MKTINVHPDSDIRIARWNGTGHYLAWIQRDVVTGGSGLDGKIFMGGRFRDVGKYLLLLQNWR
jgi:hypothetical protein